MELIHAKEAYAHTVLAKRNARRVMFEDLALCFNKYVNEAAAHAETAILLRWRDFDINEELATDEEALTELLNNVMAAGYEAEFCYISLLLIILAVLWSLGVTMLLRILPICF